MARRKKEVLNTSETEILEKKDGEGVDAVDNPETGTNPQNPNGVEENDTVGEQSNSDGATVEVITNPKDTEQSDADKKNPEGRGGKRLIQHTGLKNGRVIVFDGSFVEFDKEGIAEVDDKYAEFLLQIPGYESVKEAK